MAAQSAPLWWRKVLIARSNHEPGEMLIKEDGMLSREQRALVMALQQTIDQLPAFISDVNYADLKKACYYFDPPLAFLNIDL